MIVAGDRRGDAPPITGRFAAPGRKQSRRPLRLHRPRWRKAAAAPGPLYVGPPTKWGNPFQVRPRIGQARSVILYRAWLNGELTPRILGCAGFGTHEIATLGRRRRWLLERLPQIAGRDLQCSCPADSVWCHADVLIALANSGATRTEQKERAHG